MQNKSFYVTILATVLALGLGGPAHAEWVFDHFKIGEGKLFRHIRNYRWGKVEVLEAYNPGIDVTGGGSGRCQATGSSIDEFTQRWNPSYAQPYDKVINVTTTASVTLTPYYRWHTGDNFDPETDEPIIEPADQKPFWIFETFEVAGSLHIGDEAEQWPAVAPVVIRMNSAQTTPAKQDEDGRNPPPYFKLESRYDDNGHPQSKKIGMKFSKIQPTGNWAAGQPRGFSYSLSASRPTGFQYLNQYLHLGLGFSYTADIVRMGLLVKPMEGNGGNAGIAQKLQEDPDYVWGNGNLTGNATLTAGGIDNYQHKCEVWMSVEPSVGVLPVRCYPKVGITYKNGKVVPAKLVPLELGDIPTAHHWDLAGNYLAYIGEIVSRDVTERVDGHTEIRPTIYLGKGSGNPTAEVQMGWGDVEWRLGGGGIFGDSRIYAGNNTFDANLPDGYSESIWARVTKVEGNSNVPLQGHSYELKPGRVVLWEEDPDTNDVTTHIFTTDPYEIQANRYHPEIKVTYKDDLTSAVQEYFNVTTGAVSEDGWIQGRVTVNRGIHFQVRSFKVQVQDTIVFTKNKYYDTVQ